MTARRTATRKTTRKATTRTKGRKGKETKPPSFCRECGLDVPYVVANERNVDAESLAAAQKLTPMDQAQHIARGMLKLFHLRPSRGEYLVGKHREDYVLSPKERSMKWSQTEIENIADMLAPVAVATKKTWKVYPSVPKHIYG